MNKEKKIELKINVPEENQSPNFSNVVQVNATSREVVLDFAFVQPNTDEGIMVSRVVLTIEHTKVLVEALIKALKKCDNKKDEIKL